MKAILFKHPWWFAAVLMTTFLSAIADVYFAFVIKGVVDISSKQPELFFQTFLNALLFLVLAILLAFVRKAVESYYLKETQISFKNMIFKGQLSQSISQFNKVNSAEYISSLTNDMTLIEQDYLLNILELIDNVFIFIVSVSSLVMISWKVTLAVLFFGFLPLLIPAIFKKALRQRKLRYSNFLGEFTTNIKDIFSGFEVIKGFNIQQPMTRRFETANASLEKEKFKFRILQFLVECLGSGAGSLMHLMAIGTGAYFVSRGEMSFGDLLAMIQLMGFVVNPVVQMANRINKINATRGIVDKVSRFISVTKCQDIVRQSFASHIFLKNVCFSFGEKKVLNNITYSFKKGKKYAVIGKSGSGKSTLLKLLLDYYSPQDGEVGIDGKTYDELGDQVYDLITPIHQNVYMFDQSIRENITLYREYVEEEIEQVVQASSLKSLIQQKEKGLWESVGENGNLLSGGEKQRVSIARALIKNTDIILADEATSALDAATSAQINQQLLCNNDRTVIAVTHDVNETKLALFDEILLMEHGKIVASGPLATLKNKTVYQQLVEQLSND